MAKRKFHYAWVILLACCMVQGAVIGVIQNCKGIFYEPVCASLGFNLGSFTLHQFFNGAGSVLMAPFVGRFYRRYPLRIVLTVALVFYVLSVVAMGASSALWHWYVTGFVQGMSGIFLMFTLQPYLLGNWFEKYRGTVLGISAMASGLMGVIVNIVIADLIGRMGWRMGYFVLAGAAFLLAAPATVFMIRSKPSDMGLLPYGVEDVSEIQVAEQQERGKIERKDLSGLVYIALLAAASSFLSGYSQHLANYARTIGQGVMVGASMISASMVGNIGGKLLIGFLNDRFGVRVSSYSSFGLLTGSFVMFTFFPDSIVALFIGAALSGVSMSINSVQLPLMGAYVYDKAKYTAVLSYISIAITLGGAIGVPAIGGMYDRFGSYAPTFWMGLVVGVACVALLPVLYRRSVKRANKA